jgi:pyrimidine-nucleoside phosphorylase
MRIPQWVIEKKRDGGELDNAEIADFIQGYNDGSIPAYQMAALAMAIYLRGMSDRETAALTRAMMDTGRCLDTSALTRPVCDKHSTGGIGDMTSLILGPLAAACGLAVPMISGRGLGITGGTLDKLESIPGFRANLDEDDILRVVADVGVCIVGQTERLAPADKKLYALRDVTATVPSIPLITASIMCKKLSEGLGSLVLDVKHGRGAFMKTLDDARRLADSMVRVGREMNTPVAVLLTDMDSPLGRTAGNALEVAESIAILQGRAEGPLWEVTRELCAAMLQVSGLHPDADTAGNAVDDALHSGRGLDIFNRMVRAQGGDPDPAKLPCATLREVLPCPATGWIADVDPNAVGRAVLVLGGGRTRAEDNIDPAVGLSDIVRIGETIQRGQPLCVLHANDPARLSEARKRLENAFRVSETAVAAPSRITERRMPT